MPHVLAPALRSLAGARRVSLNLRLLRFYPGREILHRAVNQSLLMPQMPVPLAEIYRNTKL